MNRRRRRIRERAQERAHRRNLRTFATRPFVRIKGPAVLWIRNVDRQTPAPLTRDDLAREAGWGEHNPVYDMYPNAQL